MQYLARWTQAPTAIIVPFGVTYEKIGTIQRRLAWPLHKDDTLSRSGRPTGLNIYCFSSLHTSTIALPVPRSQFLALVCLKSLIC
ncbi:hypothetical protein BC835DRAFT_1260740 [Cytidiella melzeri]|nr:hypothetical protein BC835DRAFT_1260740 [Cytidiella melzeri]